MTDSRGDSTDRREDSPTRETTLLVESNEVLMERSQLEDSRTIITNNHDAQADDSSDKDNEMTTVTYFFLPR